MRGGASSIFFKVLVAGSLAAVIPVHAQDPDEPTDTQRTPDPQLLRLATEFYSWMDENQPVSQFAILRPHRPEGWEPDWSQTSLQRRKVEYLQFQGRLKAISTLGFDVADRVDSALLGSAMDRIHWELEVLASPSRDPGFYLDQSLGSVFELLIQAPSPPEPEIEDLILRLKRFPALINSAKLNLDRVVRVLAEATIARIGDPDLTVAALEAALSDSVPERLAGDFEVGLRAARQSLSSYKDWLTISLDRFGEPPSVGAQRYRWYLGHVAMVPRDPEALSIESEIGAASAGALLAVNRQRYSGAPDSTGLDRADRLVQLANISRQEVGIFLASADLVSGPGEFATLELAILPPALAPFNGTAQATLFASGEDGAGIHYLPEKDQSFDIVDRLAWADPRLLMTWAGIPGLQAQYWSTSGNPDPIRRHATNASLGEGIALYFHEQVMGAGLYSLSPASLELAIQLLRHCAALALTDGRVASGDWDLEQAVKHLVDATILTRAQALMAVESLVASPGKAGASYAAYGQAIRFLADSARIEGESFSLREFNDRLLENANVPIALQRWESLGLEDELDQLIEQRGRPATVPE